MVRCLSVWEGKNMGLIKFLTSIFGKDEPQVIRTENLKNGAGKDETIFYYSNGAKRIMTKCYKYHSIEEMLQSMEKTVRKMR